VIFTVLGGFWQCFPPCGLLFSLPLVPGLWLPNMLAPVTYLSLCPPVSSTRIDLVILLKDHLLGARALRALKPKGRMELPCRQQHPCIPKPAAPGLGTPTDVGWQVEDTDMRLQEPLRPDTSGRGLSALHWCVEPCCALVSAQVCWCPHLCWAAQRICALVTRTSQTK